MAANKESGTQLVIRPTAAAVLEQFERFVADIPDWEDDGGLTMAADIFQAATPGDLDARWDEVSENALLNHAVRYEELEKAPSTIDGAQLPFYIIAYGVNLTNGERVRVTTSSVAVCAQLATAHAKGWLPMTAKLREGEKTRKGFFPKHLEIVDHA